MLKRIVDCGELGDKGDSSEQDAWKDARPTSVSIEGTIRKHVDVIFEFLRQPGDRRSFDTVERGLIPLLFALGRLFIAFFLAWREEHSQVELHAWGKKGYRLRLPQPRLVGTFFGKVRYWRTYMKEEDAGLYPLDLALGLTADGFSMLVVSLAARLSTRMSYDQVTETLSLFLDWSPSKTTAEKTVMGLGKHTEEWFLKAPVPEDDGEVLVTQIDSKATPTATDSELERRRGKRRKNPFPRSPRHRGRANRLRRGPKRRRKKGDKSKNGKAAHLVVQYTLKQAKGPDGMPALLGPRNRKVYASYVSKRHAFGMARRLADKRGFSKNSGKRHQLITDGDEHFERLAQDFFPEAIRTLDVMHVLEYVWEAGHLLFREGSADLTRWIEKMKKLLYGGKALEMTVKIGSAHTKTPKTGPGNKHKRERLASIRDYLLKRIDQMNYDSLRAEDLEIASGSVEGAVNHVIALRFDKGGMRWIRERAQPLLQLRCIDLNGDWDQFITFVHQKAIAQAKESCEAQAVLSLKPNPLSEIAESA